MTARLPGILLLLLPLAVGCTPLQRYFDARALDLADCAKANVGVGIGLTADAKATDVMAPGIGIVSYTVNFGHESRKVNGVWLENIVINTPRFAYEAVAREINETPADEELNGPMVVSQLAFRSVLLPNERWIRKDDELTVEYYTLFNIGGFGRENRATALAGLLRRTGETPRELEKTVWQASSFEVGATLGVIEARVGINPMEILDFLVGIFGLDLAGDDPPPPVIVVEPTAGGPGRR